MSGGFHGIGFSSSATTSGTLTARLGAKTGYDTSDTDEVQVVVTSGPAWVIKLAEDALPLRRGRRRPGHRGGGDGRLRRHAGAVAGFSNNSVLRLALITEVGTARSPGDFATLGARYFPSSTCSADPNAGNVQVCRLNATFTPVDDAEAEPDETLTLTLQRPPAARARFTSRARARTAR